MLNRFGDVFPPQSWTDIDAYDEKEMLSGYIDQAPDELDPGPNHPPAYRWGWQNSKRDRSHENDGYDHLRHEWLRRKKEMVHAD